MKNFLTLFLMFICFTERSNAQQDKWNHVKDYRLYYGSQSFEVRVYRAFLIRAGYLKLEKGEWGYAQFGRKVKLATIELQKQLLLESNGICDKQMMEMIIADPKLSAILDSVRKTYSDIPEDNTDFDAICAMTERMFGQEDYPENTLAPVKAPKTKKSVVAVSKDVSMSSKQSIKPGDINQEIPGRFTAEKLMEIQRDLRRTRQVKDIDRQTDEFVHKELVLIPMPMPSENLTKHFSYIEDKRIKITSTVQENIPAVISTQADKATAVLQSERSSKYRRSSRSTVLGVHWDTSRVVIILITGLAILISTILPKVWTRGKMLPILFLSFILWKG